MGRARTSLTIAIITVILVGCLSSPDEVWTDQHPEAVGDVAFGWEIFPQGADWVIIEVIPTSDGLFVAGMNVNWTFPRAVSTTPEVACFASALGGTELVGATRYLPRHPWVRPFDSVEFEWSGPARHLHLVPFGGEEGFARLEFGDLSAGTPVYALVGHAEREKWVSAGSTFDYRLEAMGAREVTFRWSVVDSGTMECATWLASFDEGDFLRSNVFTYGENLVKSFELDRGAVVWLNVSSDVKGSARIVGPSGVAWQDSMSVMTDSGVAVGAKVIGTVLCSDEPGSWSIEVPELVGRDHQRTWVSYAVLDVPPIAHEAIECFV